MKQLQGQLQIFDENGNLITEKKNHIFSDFYIESLKRVRITTASFQSMNITGYALGNKENPSLSAGTENGNRCEVDSGSPLTGTFTQTSFSGQSAGSFGSNRQSNLIIRWTTDGTQTIGSGTPNTISNVTLYNSALDVPFAKIILSQPVTYLGFTRNFVYTIQTPSTI